MPRVVHFEIYADDLEKIRNFYQGVFGWQINKWDGPQEYWLVNTGDEKQPGINGGLLRRREGLNARTINTINVPSIEEFVEKIERGGGTICVPKMAIQGIGWLAFAQDPEGNVFGILQPSAASAAER